MLSLQMAEAFVVLSLDQARFNADITAVEQRLRALPDQVQVSITASSAGLDAVFAQIRQLQALAAQPIVLQVGTAQALAGSVPSMARVTAAATAGVAAAPAGAVGMAAAPQVDVGVTRLEASGVQMRGRLEREAALQAERQAQWAIAAGTASDIRGPQLNVAAADLAARRAIAAGRASDIQRGPQVDVSLGQLQASGLQLQDRVRRESDRRTAQATAEAGRRQQQSAYNRTSFAMGIGQGLGLPFAANPYQMAGTAVAGGAVASVRTAMDLETQFAQLQRITGMTAEQLSGFRDQLMAFSTRTGAASTRELIGMAQVGGRMGVMDQPGAAGGAAGLMAFTQQLTRVRQVITDIPAEQLANRIGQVLGIMGQGTNQVAGFGSALAALDNVSKASASDILEISNRLAGAARAAQMSTPALLALSSVLSDVGMRPQAAAGAMAQIFPILATQSARVAQQIGTDAQSFRAAYEQGPLVALGLVIDRYNQIQGLVARQEFLRSIGLTGVETQRAFQSLAPVFPQVAERTRMAEREQTTQAALGAAETTMGATGQVGLNQLSNALTGLQAAIGQMLIPTVNEGARALAGLAGVLTRVVQTVTAIPGFDTAARTVGGAVAAGAIAPAVVVGRTLATGGTAARAVGGAVTSGIGVGGALATGGPGLVGRSLLNQFMRFVPERMGGWSAARLAEEEANVQTGLGAPTVTAAPTRPDTRPLAYAAETGRTPTGAIPRRPGMGMAAAGAMAEDMGFGTYQPQAVSPLAGLLGLGPRTPAALAGLMTLPGLGVRPGATQLSFMGPLQRPDRTRAWDEGPDQRERLPRYETGLTGADVGRHIQEALLNQDRDMPRRQLAEHQRTNTILTAIQGALTTGAGGIQGGIHAAVLAAP